MLERWDPFRELRRREASFDRFRRDVSADRWMLPLDVVENADAVVIEATVVGMKPEDIDVTIDDGVLKVTGSTGSEHEESTGRYVIRERRKGKFYRALRLPRNLDTEKAESSYKNGVLTITLPKAEDAKAKHIEVKAAA